MIIMPINSLSTLSNLSKPNKKNMINWYAHNYVDEKTNHKVFFPSFELMDLALSIYRSLIKVYVRRKSNGSF